MTNISMKFTVDNFTIISIAAHKLVFTELKCLHGSLSTSQMSSELLFNDHF